jgi:hypothetical protein
MGDLTPGDAQSGRCDDGHFRDGMTEAAVEVTGGSICDPPSASHAHSG